MLPIPRLWLLTVVPVAIAIVPISKLTLWLVLVLAVDVAVALLLARDFAHIGQPTPNRGWRPSLENLK